MSSKTRVSAKVMSMVMSNILELKYPVIAYTHACVFLSVSFSIVLSVLICLILIRYHEKKTSRIISDHFKHIRNKGVLMFYIVTRDIKINSTLTLNLNPWCLSISVESYQRSIYLATQIQSLL